LLVDGHSSYLTKKFLEYCHRHKILLDVYLLYSIYTLQPLNIVICRRPSAAVNLNCITNRAAQGPEYRVRATNDRS
jgi:hypothetical protein